MTNSSAFRQRLSDILSHLTPNRVVGIGGLAVLCSASALSLLPTPTGEPDLTRLITQAVGGLGLNVLASVLEKRWRSAKRLRHRFA